MKIKYVGGFDKDGMLDGKKEIFDDMRASLQQYQAALFKSLPSPLGSLVYHEMELQRTDLKRALKKAVESGSDVVETGVSIDVVITALRHYWLSTNADEYSQKCFYAEMASLFWLEDEYENTWMSFLEGDKILQRGEKIHCYYLDMTGRERLAQEN